jgi:hypothetical protein
MNIIKYSALPFNNMDAALDIINECIGSTDPQLGLDIGDGQVAVFEVRDLDDDVFYLKETLVMEDEEVVDEDTKGEYEIDQLVEVIISRLQTLDDLTDYPRTPTSVKNAIEKALEVLGEEKRYNPNQPRDSHGRFGSGGAVHAKPSGKTGPAIPTTDSQRKIKIDDSKLAAGKNRNLPRPEVLSVYQAKVKAFNPGFTKASDGGAVFNFDWKDTDRPANYPKDIPHNPRPQKAKAGDFTKEYKPFATKEEMMGWMHEGDLGAHKARVALHELYSFARQRQGDFDKYDYAKTDNAKGDAPDSCNRFLEKHKLTSFDVDIHHMIPAGMGGSNKGPNLVALSATEHTIAHILEWSAAKVYDKSGNVAKQGKWGGGASTFEATGANIRANNMYRALTLQTCAAKKSGNVKEYFKQAMKNPSRRQSMFATQKALRLLKKMKLIDTDDVMSLKLNSTGRPVWTLGSKDATIKALEANILKGLDHE